MKFLVIILSAAALVLLSSAVCVGALTGDTLVWVGGDLQGINNKIGYFRQEERFTKIVATTSPTSNYFDMTFGYQIISFENAGGLYGELGVNSSNGKLNPLFGAGFTYNTPGSFLIALIGSKYYPQKQQFISEGQLFIRIIDPVIFNAGYDTNSNLLIVGIGLKFH